ncbi:PLP-dependent aminotransferase family protein [Pendulispora brunnea]|uniref:PLP-dependent aminotransferase family protein n=1 Tax=Pendulispora brunnea TaxID=2905690 RepID=A0ABZ2K2S3_9BACT
MTRRSTAPLVSIHVARAGAGSIAQALREAIARGSLPPGSRLPATRTLASDLGVSRTTVEAAFAQLDSEGLLVRRVGVGTFVAPTASRDVSPLPGKGQSHEAAPPPLSTRGRALVDQGRENATTLTRAFTPCIPNLDAFPFGIWNRLLARRAKSSGPALAGAIDPAGLPALREAVAAYAGSHRGVRCTYRHVLIASSTQQVLDLCARVLLDPGDAVWMEEPGYLGARSAFRAGGADLVPVPVDADGLSVDAGIARAPHARLAYVTPSFQYPLGVTMGSARRRALLAWARDAGAWIFEDDYDSEFRFAGRPLAAIQGTDAHAHVLYAGTFNKVMFPSLRLAYLIAPVDVIDALVLARLASDGPPPALLQATMADFISEGHFAAHIRATRTLCEERRDTLLDSVSRELQGTLTVDRTENGMHCVGWLPRGENDATVSHRVHEHGLDLPPLSRYFLESSRAARPALLVSYAAASPAEIRAGIRLLATLL